MIFHPPKNHFNSYKGLKGLYKQSYTLIFPQRRRAFQLYKTNQHGLNTSIQVEWRLTGRNACPPPGFREKNPLCQGSEESQWGIQKFKEPVSFSPMAFPGGGLWGGRGDGLYFSLTSSSPKPFTKTKQSDMSNCVCLANTASKQNSFSSPFG